MFNYKSNHIIYFIIISGIFYNWPGKTVKLEFINF
jgi:hypothetical protein